MKCNIDGTCIKDLVANKSQHMKDKKSLPVESEVLKMDVEIKSDKADGDYLHIKVVANLPLYIDSDVDALSPTAFNKSINDKDPKDFKMLKNHQHNTDGVIGTVTDVYMTEVDTQKYNGVQALIFEADIYEKYDSKVFNMYKNGEIDQHSIGFQYIKLDLAVNDDTYEDEYKVWLNTYDQLLNKDVADTKGYYWWVSEVKLYENSAVLFGANDQTPTVETEEKDIDVVGIIKSTDFFGNVIRDTDYFKK